MKKILVVDDEPDVLEVVSFRLKRSGYEVMTAVNGKVALDIIRADKPGLVLLDLRMPVMDGYEVSRAIKNDEKLKDIPVILLTASSGSSVDDMIHNSKADGFLVKPFSPEDLLKKVSAFLG